MTLLPTSCTTHESLLWHTSLREESSCDRSRLFQMVAQIAAVSQKGGTAA